MFLKELVVVVDVCCAKVKGEWCRVMVLLHAEINVIVGEML